MGVGGVGFLLSFSSLFVDVLTFDSPSPFVSMVVLLGGDGVELIHLLLWKSQVVWRKLAAVWKLAAVFVLAKV